MRGDHLDTNYVAYQHDQMTKLLMNVDVFGIGIFGDGAPIVKVPIMNIIACLAGNPCCVLDVVDCTDHVAKGNKKDAFFWVVSRCCLACNRLIQRRRYLI
jgi:hypothetical protein